MHCLKRTRLFPVHDDEHKVLKDITKWKEAVKAPPQKRRRRLGMIKNMAAGVDRNEYFVTVFMAPGIFEQMHYLMGMDDTSSISMKNGSHA